MPRAGNPATDKAVKALRPRATRYVELYSGGLGVRVAPTGTKTWIYWYRLGERKRQLTLGTYPDMTLADANVARNRASEQRSAGADPAAAKVATRKRQPAGAPFDLETGTVRQCFDDWKTTDLKYRVEPDGTRHGRKDGGAALAGQFDTHVFPTLGDLPLRKLGMGHVSTLLDRTKNAGKYRTAAVLLASLRQMLDYAEAHEYIGPNPIRLLKQRRAVGRAKERDRVLDDKELRKFLRVLPTLDLHPVTVLALRFVLATGQRPGEVAGMPKAELDGKVWTIPAARYKTGEEQKVPLSSYARALLREAAKFNHASAYVFPSPTDDERPLDRHSLSRAILRKLTAFGFAHPFTPHDLRRTCRTGMAALGVPEHIAERVIGHKLEGMMAVYNRHPYLDEKLDALTRWGKVLA